MAWRDDLRPASFRGVPFAVASTDGEIGRRTVVHQYPKRDIPYAEDLGRKPREFTLEAINLGLDYMAARDKLIIALEQPGAGELVHPYRGRLSVAIVSARLTESTDQGGAAFFSLTFTESGENLHPATKTDTKAAVKKAADKAKTSVIDSFSKFFNISGISFLINSASYFSQSANSPETTCHAR